MLLGLLVSVILAVIGVSSWNHVSIEWEPVVVVLAGSTSLLLGMEGADFIYRRANSLRLRASGRASENDGASYSLPSWKYIVVDVVLILAIVVRIIETYKIGSQIGADMSSYSTVSSAVRGALETINTSEGMLVGTGFSLVERQLEKVATAAGYVAAGLLAISLVRRSRQRAAHELVAISLSCIFCLVSGSRTAIAYYVVAFLVSLFISMPCHEGKQKRLSAIFLISCTAVAAIGAVVFYQASALVGRGTTSGLLEYITFYFGGGIPSFQHLLSSGNLPSLAPGILTFYYLFAVPYKIGLIDTYPSYSISWVDMGGHPSNIFTGFARYYLDFGLPGVIILCFFSSFIMTVVYREAKRKAWPPLIIFAGFLGGYAFDFAREEFFFSRLMSPNQLITVIFMLVLTVFLTTSVREELKKFIYFFKKEFTAQSGARNCRHR